MNNYKFKLVVFILLVISLLIVLFYGIFGFSLSYLSEEEIKEDRKLKENLISFLKINDIETVYDKKNNIYYFSIPEEYENQKYTLKLELEDQYKYKVVDHSTNIITVDYSKDYNIIIYNDKNYYETKVRLTNLPLVSVTTDNEITDNETNSIFKYINPSNLDEVVTYSSKIKVRGATSKRYDKKSYKIKIYNNDYDKEKNVNISNFYYGSAFILDAMYRDSSKVRNVLATDIWDDISNDFTNVDVYSEYVEVFINGEYRGLYSFTEPINRKNLNLSKSSSNDTSVIVKTSEWTIPSNNSFLNITEDTYLGYELKYPNDEELFNLSWKSVLTKLSKYYKDFNKSDYDTINEVFDMNNYIDLILFNSFINNSDNGMKKNNYFYSKTLNDKLYIQPWDMEFCFGLKFSEIHKNNFVKDISDYDEILFDIYHKNSKEINKLLIKRYWELRKNVLSEEYLDTLLDSYKNKLIKGSGKRDSKLWLEYNIEEEIEDVRTWLHKRIEVYDEYIRGLENE